MSLAACEQLTAHGRVCAFALCSCAVLMLIAPRNDKVRRCRVLLELGMLPAPHHSPPSSTPPRPPPPPPARRWHLENTAITPSTFRSSSEPAHTSFPALRRPHPLWLAPTTRKQRRHGAASLQLLSLCFLKAIHSSQAHWTNRRNHSPPLAC